MTESDWHILGAGGGLRKLQRRTLTEIAVEGVNDNLPTLFCCVGALSEDFWKCPLFLRELDVRIYFGQPPLGDGPAGDYNAAKDRQ